MAVPKRKVSSARQNKRRSSVWKLEKPEILKAAREEFNENAAAGYDCPIGPEVKPSAQ